jgi:vacuolar protein sorting-associated protein 13A/C
LGNPVGLLNNLGTGVNDFISAPADGYKKSAEEFGLGVWRGGSSLGKNTVFGVFNSVSSITGSLSQGLATLSSDQSYLRARSEQQYSDRPQGALEGFMSGVSNVGDGFLSGVAGIFEAPAKGAHKAGMRGFVKGLGQGVAGLVLKPMTGLFDGVSKLSEGIKNSAASDLGLFVQPVRPARMFYGRDRTLRVYSKVWTKYFDELSHSVL